MSLKSGQLILSMPLYGVKLLLLCSYSYSQIRSIWAYHFKQLETKMTSLMPQFIRIKPQANAKPADGRLQFSPNRSMKPNLSTFSRGTIDARPNVSSMSFVAPKSDFLKNSANVGPSASSLSITGRTRTQYSVRGCSHGTLYVGCRSPQVGLTYTLKM